METDKKIFEQQLFNSCDCRHEVLVGTDAIEEFLFYLKVVLVIFFKPFQD